MGLVAGVESGSEGGRPVELMKGLALDAWYKLMTAAGLVLAVASVAAKYPPTILVGLGMVLFGIGEMVNHRTEEAIFPATAYMPSLKATREVRSARIGGVLLDAVGIILGAAGLIRLIFA